MLGECVSSFPPPSVLQMRLPDTAISFTNEKTDEAETSNKWSISPKVPIPPTPIHIKSEHRALLIVFMD